MIYNDRFYGRERVVNEWKACKVFVEVFLAMENSKVDGDNSFIFI